VPCGVLHLYSGRDKTVRLDYVWRLIGTETGSLCFLIYCQLISTLIPLPFTSDVRTKQRFASTAVRLVSLDVRTKNIQSMWKKMVVFFNWKMIIARSSVGSHFERASLSMRVKINSRLLSVAERKFIYVWVAKLDAIIQTNAIDLHVSNRFYRDVYLSILLIHCGIFWTFKVTHRHSSCCCFYVDVTPESFDRVQVPSVQLCHASFIC
jgi:hypothetical protein